MSAIRGKADIGQLNFELPLGCRLCSNDEIVEIGSLMRGAFRPKDEQPASVLRGVRTVRGAGLDVQRRAGQVPLALVGEIALNDVEHFSNVLVQMRRNNRARLHREMQHYWT